MVGHGRDFFSLRSKLSNLKYKQLEGSRCRGTVAPDQLFHPRPNKQPPLPAVIAWPQLSMATPFTHVTEFLYDTPSYLYVIIKCRLCVLNNAESKVTTLRQTFGIVPLHIVDRQYIIVLRHVRTAFFSPCLKKEILEQNWRQPTRLGSKSQSIMLGSYQNSSDLQTAVSSAHSICL